MFLHLQTLRRHVSRPVAAGVSFLSERRCGVTVCVQSRPPSLSGFFLGSDFCSPCCRWFYGHCRMHHGCAVRMETVQVHVASSLSVDLTWWPRRTTPMAPDLLPRYQSEASQSTTKVTKYSAATADSPQGREESFLLTREEFSAPAIGRTSPTCSSTASPSIGSSLHAAVQETEQWVGLCLVPVRFRTYDEQLEALTQVPSPQAAPSLNFVETPELRSRRHLCNDRFRWSKQRLKP